MATSFNTQTGNGKYQLQFETDNKSHFLLMQGYARLCVDLGNVNKNTAFIEDSEDLSDGALD